MILPPGPEQWADEIRSWLIARLAKHRKAGAIDRHGPASLGRRALGWWIFEGRRYPWLDRELASCWNVVHKQANILLATSNPRWSVVDAPEGETDWAASAFQSLTACRPSFVTRAHRPGLGQEERGALLGWLSWVHRVWAEYVKDVGPPPNVSAELPWQRAYDAPDEDPRLLRRWAHVAKRSRWPLLRNVVAESLRSVFEEQDIDRLTLPTDRAQLFELLCMVRVLKALSWDSDQVRWLDPENGNRVQLSNLTYLFQHSFPQEAVVESTEFAPGLRRAIYRHDISAPTRLDGFLEFVAPRAGFDAILLESKSGTQNFDAAIYQLKCYRAALAAKNPGRMLIWGIIETPPEGYQGVPRGVIAAEARERPTEDLWVFSTADEVYVVLEALGLASGRLKHRPSEHQPSALTL
jgi:hypothetical protein